MTGRSLNMPGHGPATMKLRTMSGVAGETARVQDDAQTRLDALLLAAICDDNALHLAVSVGQQTRDLGIEHEFRTLLLGLLAAAAR